LLTLSRFPLLPDDSLVGSLRHPPFDIQARLANHDKLTNPAEVWSALDNEIRPSISYIITLALDPWQEISGPIVRTRTLRTGQVDKSPRSGHHQPQAQNELVRIGGFVRQKDKSQAPVVGIQVGIKGTAFLAESDEAGQFSLGSVAPGKYTLVAWSTNGRPQEINITVPTKKGNYDIEI
jgi:hypothetical protein